MNPNLWSGQKCGLALSKPQLINYELKLNRFVQSNKRPKVRPWAFTCTIGILNIFFSLNGAPKHICLQRDLTPSFTLSLVFDLAIFDLMVFLAQKLVNSFFQMRPKNFKGFFAPFFTTPSGLTSTEDHGW